jgi:2-C-methyl-D-erythritol 2,4-cyclodiphosphate synthase
MTASSGPESPANPAPTPQVPPPAIRVGLGYDLHRLEPLAPDGPGRPLILGGIRLDHDWGPVAHSDGDALLHAITDAVLGACALPDIGELFPDTAGDNESRDSADFLLAALAAARDAGYAPSNLDATVVLERPKLKDRKREIRANLAHLLGLPLDRVNVKGKTHERVDAVGEGRAVEVHAAVLMTITR